MRLGRGNRGGKERFGSVGGLRLAALAGLVGTVGLSGGLRGEEEGAADLLDRLRPYAVPPERFHGDGGGYRSPLLFDDGRPVDSPEKWPKRRAEILDRWHGLMGDWPEPVKDLEVAMSEGVRREGYTEHSITFRWLPNQRTRGFLLLPTNASARANEPWPAVLTVYYEPETSAGHRKERRDFSRQLARRGFVALSIGTTETTEAKHYALYYPNREEATVQPLSLLAYAASQARRVLAGLDYVDASRIGICGHSYGGKWAMFASCLDEGFAAAAWSDPGIVFDESRSSVNYWEPWYLGYVPPPWRKRGVISDENPATGLYPELVERGMDLHELHALMAPRPFLVSGGSEDPPERWRALHHSIAVNRLLGHENRVFMTNRPGHGPTEASNDVMYAFFEYFLRRGGSDPQAGEGL